MVNLDEAVQEFLVESRENLDQLDRDFVALETKPGDKERIAGIFRTIHTIKGTAGFLGFSRLEGLTHAGESVLSSVRDGSLALTPELTTALLAMVDRVRGMLQLVETTARDGEATHDDLIQRLLALRTAGAGSTSTPPTPAPAAPAPTATTTADAQKGAKSSKASTKAAAAEATPAPAPAASPAPAPDAPPAAPASTPAPAPAPAPAAAAPPTSTPAKPNPTVEAATSDLNVRVDVGLLDKLMNLVGELVLARNQLVQIGARIEDPAFVSASQRLSLITTELQENVMKTRMQPIGVVWSKLPRVVRDLSVSLGKQVRVEMIGTETELDRTILEAIKDPLTHIVRNSVDHGIESFEARAASGKPRTGTLTLRAFHEGGQVNVEISDDGAGINVEAIRRKAIERGLLSPERVARMSEFDLTQIIFLPGFSTAEKVSNISGRGVGMDVVKTNIERIGGTVDVVSRLGEGTTLRIKIPLTLAIIPALLTSSDNQRYAIPQVNLVELVHVDDDDKERAIEHIQGSSFFRLRGRLLPLVFLADQLSGTAHARRGARRRSRAGGIDIDGERARYTAMTAKLSRFVAEGVPLPVDEPTRAADSALGRWLAARSEASEPVLRAAHKAFFDAVQAVVTTRDAGDIPGAFRALADVGNKAGVVVEELARLGTQQDTGGGTNIVVVQADDHQFGLVVDEVLDTEEIVVKPLGKELKGLPVYAGATIMGDGRVALILDVAGLAQHAAATQAEHSAGDEEEEGDESRSTATKDEKHALLVFSVGEGEVLGLPLSTVARIEEFPYEKIERLGRRPVAQYRGAILPLIELGPVLGPIGGPQDPKRPVHVIVYAQGDRSIGLIVAKILDVVEESFVLDQSAARSSVLGAAVVQGRVIEILDIDDIVRTQAPTLLPRSAV